MAGNAKDLTRFGNIEAVMPFLSDRAGVSEKLTLEFLFRPQGSAQIFGFRTHLKGLERVFAIECAKMIATGA